VNTRHVKVAAVVEQGDVAIEQVDAVVIASTVVGRRPGDGVQRPACGSKRSCACVIQA
jgi:hypothetical protein